MRKRHAAGWLCLISHHSSIYCSGPAEIAFSPSLMLCRRLNGHNVSSSSRAAYSTDSVTQRCVITENKAEKNEAVLLLPLSLKNA